VFISGLSGHSSSSLRAVFSSFGDVKSVTHSAGEGSGGWFVEFAEAEECAMAIDNMHEAELFGNVVKVQMAVRHAGPRNRAIWEDQENTEAKLEKMREEDIPL